MAETATAPVAEMQFGLPLDPLRPQELVLPPGIATMPPACPTCEALLHPANNNHAGDILFECGNDGYMTVLRVASNTWEQRPRFEQEDWKAPLIAGQKKPVPHPGIPEIKAPVAEKHVRQIRTKAKPMKRGRRTR